MKKAYEDKIKALFTNEELTKKMEALEDIEKIGELFKEYGVDMAEEELADFLQSAIDAKQKTELDVSELENVAGGLIGGAVKLLGATWGFACDYWGGPKQAINATVSFWSGVFR